MALLEREAQLDELGRLLCEAADCGCRYPSGPAAAVRMSASMAA